MTTDQFNDALRHLGLSVYAAPAVLKVTLRQIQRYSSGDQAVEARVATILEMLLDNIRYLKHRCKELKMMIAAIDERGLRIQSNNQDETSAWRGQLNHWLTEIEGMLRKHPSGLPDQS